MPMFFPYLELAASLFILLLAFEILVVHFDNKLAKFFSFFALVAFFAAILTYSYRIAFTLEIARDINRLSASLLAFTFALFAHFAINFTKNEAAINTRLKQILFYLPPALIAGLFFFTNSMYLRYEIQHIGIVSTPAPLYLLFALETVLYCGLGIVLLLKYAAKTSKKMEQQQALIIAIGSLGPLSIGLFFDQLIPLIWGIRIAPPTVIFDIAFMNLFIYLAMRNYSLFSLSPAKAAEAIIETMPDSLIITDLDGCVLLINDEAKKLFHDVKHAVECRPIYALFKDKTKYDQLYKEVVGKKEVVERFEAELVDPLGEKIPALINAKIVRQKTLGELVGIVFIIRDVRG